MSKRLNIEAGEWIIKADSAKPSKFWDALDKLNELGEGTE